jgi:hypothetical protein
MSQRQRDHVKEYMSSLVHVAFLVQLLCIPLHWNY